MARWKAHGRLSIRSNWTFFRYLLWFLSYEAKFVQLGCFDMKLDPISTQILPGQGRPLLTIFDIRKLETLSYPVV